MSATPLKILAVDPAKQNLLALHRQIEGDGLHVPTATSGAEALALLQQQCVALALLDVRLPGMDGYALAERLATVSHHIRTPLTALALNAERLLHRGDDVGRRVRPPRRS